MITLKDSSDLSDLMETCATDSGDREVQDHWESCSIPAINKRSQCNDLLAIQSPIAGVVQSDPNDRNDFI